MNDKLATFADRHAVVTGASRGIGRAIAAALAAEGVRVSLLGRDTAKLAQVSGHFGPVHILINNAGRAASAKFPDTNPAAWNAILGVNLTGTYLCTRETMPDMLQLGFGRIVNIASIAGLRGAAYISAYAASKHAVIGLTRSLALEFATKNITVNAICPGYTDTDVVKEAIANIRAKTGRSETEALEALVASNPQHRLIKPEEVAHTALWLCKPGTESVTGQSIVIAGGEVM